MDYSHFPKPVSVFLHLITVDSFKPFVLATVAPKMFNKITAPLQHTKTIENKLLSIQNSESISVSANADNSEIALGKSGEFPKKPEHTAPPLLPTPSCLVLSKNRREQRDAFEVGSSWAVHRLL